MRQGDGWDLEMCDWVVRDYRQGSSMGKGAEAGMKEEMNKWL